MTLVGGDMIVQYNYELDNKKHALGVIDELLFIFQKRRDTPQVKSIRYGSCYWSYGDSWN